MVASVFLTRTLQALLNDVQPTDASVFVANAAIVLLVSVLACYMPARAAGRVDPMQEERIEVYVYRSFAIFVKRAWPVAA